MKTNNLDLRVHNIAIKKDTTEINNLISEYIPFIIKIVSDEKNSYLSVENDIEYSISLSAFHEAILKYNYEKGLFLPFAKLVIKSRLKTFWLKEKKISEKIEYIYDDNKLNNEYNINNLESTNSELRTEIELYEKELIKFGINFEILISESPKHRDTKKNAIDISKKVSQDKELVSHLYLKKRLPITKISKKFNITIKILKGNKIFIISVIILLLKKFKLIRNWLE